MLVPEQNLPEFSLPPNWEGISELFPVQKESIWLNYCGTTPISSFASSVMADYFDEYSRYGIFAPRYSEPKIKVILRNYLAEILSCSPNSIGLVHNTSEGMNLYSHSISLPKGTRILVIENEYPSNVYPWEHWKEKGVGLGFVSIGDTPDQFLQNLEAEVEKGDVSLLSLSPVHWCTGMPLDLKKISAICEKKSIKLILDGSQAVGHIPVPLNEVKVEFAAFAAWKWLLGPLGLGVIYLSPDIPKDFRILFKGQASVKNDGSYFPYRDEWKPPADQFEQSTSNFNDWIYFFASLRMLSTIGFSKVRERIYEVSDLMSDMLRGIGFRLDRDVFPGVKTGIIAVNGFSSGKEFNPDSIQNFLRSKNIYTAVRLGRLRMAPHIPVTESHISRLESALKEYLK